MTKIAILADLPVGALIEGAAGRGGGQAATWLSQLAVAFSEQNEFEIHWIVLSKEVTSIRVTEMLGQHFHQVPRGSFTLDVLTGHLLARAKLQKLLNRIHPDLIHIWGTEGSYASVIGIASCPVILSMQGILSEYDRIGSFRGNWRMRIQAFYEKKWVQGAHIITSESVWGLECIGRIASRIQTRLVEYGVNPSFYELHWNPSPNAPAILFSGGTDWRKGYDLLIESLSIPPVPDWKCWIAGSDSIGRRKVPLPLNVEMLGVLDWKKLQDLMKQAWCFVLPTRADTSPNAVKEARVVGLPVVTSCHGGQAGYILDGQNGLIIEPLTPRELRQALDRLMNDFSLCKAMGQSRLTMDRDYFRPERTSESFLSIYKELAVSNSAGNYLRYG